MLTNKEQLLREIWISWICKDSAPELNVEVVEVEIGEIDSLVNAKLEEAITVPTIPNLENLKPHVNLWMQ